jgi:hypothetical protein
MERHESQRGVDCNEGEKSTNMLTIELQPNEIEQ